MDCPYCGAAMERGYLDTQAVLRLTRHPADIVFQPEDYRERPRVSSAMARREGWYCAACRKIVGIFDVSR